MIKLLFNKLFKKKEEITAPSIPLWSSLSEKEQNKEIIKTVEKLIEYAALNRCKASATSLFMLYLWTNDNSTIFEGYDFSTKEARDTHKLCVMKNYCNFIYREHIRAIVNYKLESIAEEFLFEPYYSETSNKQLFRPVNCISTEPLTVFIMSTKLKNLDLQDKLTRESSLSAEHFIKWSIPQIGNLSFDNTITTSLTSESYGIYADALEYLMLQVKDTCERTKGSSYKLVTGLVTFILMEFYLTIMLTYFHNSETGEFIKTKVNTPLFDSVFGLFAFIYDDLKNEGGFIEFSYLAHTDHFKLKPNEKWVENRRLYRVSVVEGFLDDVESFVSVWETDKTDRKTSGVGNVVNLIEFKNKEEASISSKIKFVRETLLKDL